MADIINTAMERIGCVACTGFWVVKCDEFLCQILCIFALKWVTRMHFVRLIVVHCNVYELGCRKVDESWTKERHKVARRGIFKAERRQIGSRPQRCCMCIGLCDDTAK